MLEYRIAGLEFDGQRIVTDSVDFRKFTPHRYLAISNGQIVDFYAARRKLFKEVADRFQLNLDIPCGGAFYVDSNANTLYIGCRASPYGYTPQEWAEGFGELLLPELKREGVSITSTIIVPQRPRIT